MKAIIADDEQAARELITHCCEQSGVDLELVAICDSVESTIKAMNEHSVDLLFLDIQFGDGTGFDVLDSLDAQNFQLIFITAYKDYALNAIKHHALDYIVKPIDIQETQSAIKEAERRHLNAKLPDWKALLEQLNIEREKKIKFPMRDGFVFLAQDDIEYIKADGS